MKKQITTVVLLSVILVLTAVSMKAQTTSAFKVEIPFEFIVEGQTYQPGEYTIGRVNRQNPLMLILKTAEGEEAKVLLTRRMRSKNLVKNPSIVFSKYGETYFLSEIWTGNSKNGLQLPEGKIERNSQKFELAKKEKVTLIASL